MLIWPFRQNSMTSNPQTTTKTTTSPFKLYGHNVFRICICVCVCICNDPDSPHNLSLQIYPLLPGILHTHTCTSFPYPFQPNPHRQHHWNITFTTWCCCKPASLKQRRSLCVYLLLLLRRMQPTLYMRMYEKSNPHVIYDGNSFLRHRCSLLDALALISWLDNKSMRIIVINESFICVY